MKWKLLPRHADNAKLPFELWLEINLGFYLFKQQEDVTERHDSRAALSKVSKLRTKTRRKFLIREVVRRTSEKKESHKSNVGAAQQNVMEIS